MNYKKYCYCFIFILIVSMFLCILYDVIESTFPQLDIVWLIPNVFQHIENKSFTQILNFLFSDSPYAYLSKQGMGDLSIKSWTTLILLIFGPSTKYFIYLSIVLHIVISGLLFFLSRKIGFNSKISILSALMYLTLFAHFEAYYEPVAVQHLIVVFFSLLVMIFYLKTDQLINSDGNYRNSYLITLFLNFAASFCRQSILMLPASIFCHILFSSRNDAERINKYKLWLPMFFFYLLSPLFRLTYRNDSILSHFLSRLGLPLNYYLIFVIGLLILLLIWILLRISEKYLKWNKMKWLLVAIFSGMFIVIFISRYGMKVFVLPYYGLIPYIYSLFSFLQPFDCVLSRITEPYYYIQLPISIFAYLFGLLFIILFIKKYIYLSNNYILLIIMYLISLINHTTFSLTSRYLVYTSPFICISFCAVFVFLYDYSFKNVILNNNIRNLLLFSMFIILCLFNIIAIKYTMIRGKLVNTYLIYDDIRAANIINNEMININVDSLGEKLFINNVLPLPSNEIWGYSSTDLDPKEYYNFRFALVQIFENKSLLNANINMNPVFFENQYIFNLDDDKIINSKGKNIVKFSNYLEDGINMMNNNKNIIALELFEKAYNIRPFIVNYVMYRSTLQDLFNITNGMGMNEWTKQIYYYYQSWFSGDNKILPIKYENIKNIIEKEITDYAQCIFYISYLNYLNNNTEESKNIYSELQYLETDSDKLFELLNNIQNINKNKSMMNYLKEYNYILTNKTIFHEQGQKNYNIIKYIIEILFNIKLNFNDERGHVALNFKKNSIIE